MKQCCVIGGNGFLGRYLVGILAKSRGKVLVVDRAEPGHNPLPVNAVYSPTVPRDIPTLVKALRNMDEVVDLAYSTVPKTSFEDPVGDIRTNLPFGVDLLLAAGEAGVKKIVIVSSGGTVYGEPKRLPITEEHPTNPVSPYGITKLALEKYALMFNHSTKLPVVIVRPGNAFGPGQRPFSGQGFIATAMVSMLQRKEITVFGKHGTIRDYIYANDIARGIAAALDHGRPGHFYNIGSGIGRTNMEVLKAIHPLAQAAGLKPKIRILPGRKFDVSANILDTRKLKAQTGWRTKTSFDDALEMTWDWYLKNYGAA